MYEYRGAENGVTTVWQKATKLLLKETSLGVYSKKPTSHSKTEVPNPQPV